MDLLKVQGHTELRKDQSSGGVVNVDKRSFSEYQKAKKIAERKVREQQKSIETVYALQDEINSMKTEMHDIKELLSTLVKKL